MTPTFTTKLKMLGELILISSFAGVIYQLLGDGHVNHLAFIMGGFLGLGFGILELFIFNRYRKVFLNLPFLVTLFVKAIFYLVIINVFSGLISLIVGLSEGKAMSEFYESMLSKDQLVLGFYTLVMYLILALYIQINHLLGRGVLFKFLIGKYRKPETENRIFMFLDLKSSTAMAERLGLEKYYSLLNDFFHEISEPVYATNAEIYQYVGDEVVFTWQTKDGIVNSNCIDIFFKIKEKVNSKRKYYLDKYGEVPVFKAGLHFGDVISAQIGDIKREIIYNGDVLNTSARIQEQCNVFKRELLISGSLLEQLDFSNNYQSEKLETAQLRGKENLIELFSLVKIKLQ